MKSLSPANWPFFKHFTAVSFMSIVILSLSVLEFGFDNSIMSLVQAMDGRLQPLVSLFLAPQRP